MHGYQQLLAITATGIIVINKFLIFLTVFFVAFGYLLLYIT